MKKALLVLGCSIMIMVGIISYDVVQNDGQALMTLFEIKESQDRSDLEVYSYDYSPTLAPVRKENEPTPSVTLSQDVPQISDVEVVTSQVEDGDELEDEEKVEDVSLAAQAGEYYYNFLQNEDEKKCYRIMVDTLTAIESGTVIPTLSDERINEVAVAMNRDHPELYYIESLGYTHHTLGGQVQKTTLSVSYKDTKAAIESKRNLVQAEAKKMLVGISPNASDYDKVKYVYEKVISSTEYNPNALENQDMTSVVLYHSSVCAGYARTVQYLLNSLGVETAFVEGTDLMNNEGHAWNLVKIDGQYYYVDATWGDTSFDKSSDNGSESGVNYSYLNITTEEIMRNHVLAADMSMPQCTARDANYYVREGLYLTEYDENVIRSFFDRAYAEGKDNVTFKCSTLELHDQVKYELINNEKVFDMLREKGRTSYSDDVNQRTLCFLL